MKTFVIKTAFARRFPDPVFGPTAQRHVLLCPVKSIPTGLPKDPNPREQNIDRGIWREIRRHLLNEEGTPNTFHLKNKGITIIASAIEKVSDDDYKVVFEEGEGILDGGHTYELIVESLADIVAMGEAEPPIDQYVKLEVLTGLPQDLATEIAGGLNTAVQVQAFSLADNQDRFEWIKKALKGFSYYDEIAFRENEKTAFDVRDIIALLDLFNISSFPNDDGEHPLRAYMQKSKVLDYYVANVQEYKSLVSVLPDILTLYDTVSIEARDLHNEGGGRGANLAFVDTRQRGAYEFPFVERQGEYRLSKGALYPMLASFRWMLEADSTGMAQWTDGFDSVLQLWRDVGAELMKATQATSDDVGRKANAIGRSKNHWANLHNIVAKRHLMLLRAAR